MFQLEVGKRKLNWNFWPRNTPLAFPIYGAVRGKQWVGPNCSSADNGRLPVR